MKDKNIRAYIALGSNLEDPITQIKTAIEELHHLPNSSFITSSSLYRSEPLGPADQPHFINAVAAINTTLSAHDLLNKLQQIELKHGRTHQPLQWGPRTLDLDILLYSNKSINTPNLIIPHPEMKNRNFVLFPLAEIAPDLIFPDQHSLQSILSHSPSKGIEKLTMDH